MALDILINLVTSLIELVRLSLILSIPVFFIALFIGFVTSKITAKFGMSFAKASFISTYLTVLLLIIVLYFYPLYTGYSEAKGNEVKPPQFELTFSDILQAIPAFVIKFLWNAFVFTMLALPIEFAALFIFDWVKNKYSLPKLANLYIASFAASIATILILLFVFPFILAGLINLLYVT